MTSLCRPALSDEAFVAPATAREIAADLVVTEAAMKQHLLRLYQKFRIPEGGNRRVRLANEVVALGLVRPLPPTGRDQAPRPAAGAPGKSPGPPVSAGAGRVTAADPPEAGELRLSRPGSAGLPAMAPAYGDRPGVPGQVAEHPGRMHHARDRGQCPSHPLGVSGRQKTAGDVLATTIAATASAPTTIRRPRAPPGCRSRPRAPG